ncbi:MAG: TonB-dependent receptor [Sphingomonadales bacterium]|jgi:iron complex outermembrane receptor protein|nr:TonB-dependent receptor [Sphingomonadales bacterium]MBK6720425.1 TonB-dependent receptor [Sphingomonadales bacterium]MBK8861824.1 TonB-dependent receptor [Sphingomonadales bacterium]
MQKSRFLLASALATSSLFLLAQPAWSQDAAPQAAEDEAAGGEIVVTGSRIASPSLVSASPLQIVSDASIKSTGAANLQNVLLQNPVFGTPAVSRTNSNFGTSGVGLATVDLRNLGSARTLVLVDGRRFVSGDPNDQRVDFNTIPTPFIERVEILTGGASSIYGSDAVAGVVNVIYKKNFQGIEANAQLGVSEEGDDKTRQFNLTIGGNFAEDRGNVIAYVGYSRDGSVRSADRARSAVDQTSVGGAITGNVDDLFKITRPFFSSFAPQGRFFSAPGVTAGTFDRNGNFITGFSTNGTATRAPDGFNRSAFRTIAVPVERFLIATRANYDITPDISVFLEGTFAKSHTRSVLEPFPVSTAGTNGIFQGSGGFFPVEQRLANGTIFANPFVPAALLALLSDVDGDGLRDVSFTRRLTDIDNRGNVADRTTYRIVAGLEGKISNNWHYDAYFNYGRTDDNQTSTGQVNLANFRSALVVTQDANGNLVCADVQARAQGCVPVNVFGANKISPAAAKYIRADGNRSAFARQIDAGANISGNLLDLFGAGPIGVAAGGEYREESSAAAFDALQQAGLNGGNAIPNTSGSFDVYEGYGEVRFPILADKPFFKELTLKGAGRVSDYSTIGTVYSYNYGLEYAPSSDIRFRAVMARATRAPNVGELFQGPSQNFPTGLIDPCIGATATTSGVLGSQCRASAGVNANIAANGAFTLNQADVQGVSGFDSGNPNLKEERANTLTIGAIITPRSIDFLKNFNFTVDYSRTRIKGAIVSTPRQFILDQCFRQGNQPFCGFVVRRAGPEGANSAGSLQFINSGATNSGGVFNSSLDVTANYNKEIGGVLASASIAYTHVFKFYQVPLPGAAKDQIAGEIGAAKNRFLLTLGAKIGGLNLQYRGNYIGRSFLDDQFVLGLTDSAGNPVKARDRRASVGAKYYSDLQASFDVGDHFEFYAGVDNLFDTSPPPIISGLPGNVTGTETDAGTYDAIGRRFYSGIRLKF